VTSAPQPPGHWLLGHLMEQRRDPLGLLVRGLAQHGDIVRYRFGPYPALQLNHPRLFKRVLLDAAPNYKKWGALQRARPLLGNGLVLAEGDLWKRHRKLYGRAFRAANLAAMIPAMIEATRGLLGRWDELADGAQTDVLDDAMRVTLSIVSRTLISRDLGGGELPDADAVALGRAFDQAVHEVGARTLDLNPLVGMLPTARKRAFDRVIEQLDLAMADIVDKRRKQAEALPDLLGWLMEARDEDTGEAMDDVQLRDELLNILLAGRGTSAIGLSWMWWLLSRHPEAEQRLREEAVAVLGEEEPTAEHVERLTFANRAFQEAMRLYPPIWTIARQAVEADTIDGVPVAKGTIVLISPFVVHRHPELWPEPERFDPDRFLPERSVDRPRLAWLPFGAGPRTCIGGTFAMQEAAIIASMVSRRFRLHALHAQAPEPEPLITLKPKGGMPMRLERISP
jgi:cytochrome P450